jgi:hypothetical protein
MTNWRFFALLDDGRCRREDAVAYSAGFLNQADSLALRLLDKSKTLVHVSLLLHSDHHSINDVWLVTGPATLKAAFV